MLEYLKIYPDAKESIRRYQPADRCLLYEAAMDYAFTGAEPDWQADDFKWYAWDMLKQKIDAAERAKENGRLAGLASAQRRRNIAATQNNTPPTPVEHPSDTPSTDPELNTKVKVKVKVKDKDKEDNRRFAPPTREEVAAYIAEKGYHVDPDRWMAYYESNGWKVGRNPMKDWRAAVRTWASNGVDSKPQSRPKPVIAQQYSQRDYSGEAEINDLLDWRNEQEGSA